MKKILSVLALSLIILTITTGAKARQNENIKPEIPMIIKSDIETEAEIEEDTVTEDDVNDSVSSVADNLKEYAAKFLGTRYVWGATGPKSFDCSGFTGYVYRNFGINLDRTSREQFLQGEHVGVENLRPGDLLFFSSRSSGRGNVGHVAMVLSVDSSTQTCKFIHASVKKGVTYQTFPDGGYYQRNFIGARRILGTELDLSEAVAQN